MNKIVKRSLLLVLSLCFVLSLGYFALFSPVKVQRVDAADNTFEMVEGASIKTNGDGLRWIVKMGASVRNNIVDNSNVTLSFIIAPKSLFDSLGSTDYRTLSKKVEISVPNYNIYSAFGGYYYANAVLTNLDHNNRLSGSSDQYDYEFVAVAMITDSSAGTYTYASFAGGDMANNTRTQYDVLQDAVANEDITTAVALLNETTSPYKNWFGKGDYKWNVDTEASYTRYNVLVNGGYSGIGTLSDRSDVDATDALADAQEENPDTFAFYDTPLGKDKNQTVCYESGSLKPTITYTTEKHIEGEAGSTKLSFNASATQTSMRYYALRDSEWLSSMNDSTKYLVFYAYFVPGEDADIDYIDLGLRNVRRIRLDKNQWTMVLWRADCVYSVLSGSGTSAYFYSYYYGYKYTESSYTGANVVGDVYLSRARILDSSEIYELDNSARDITIGSARFVKTYVANNGTGNPNAGAFNNTDTYGKAFYVDGSIRFQALPPTSSQGGTSTPRLQFSTYDSIESIGGMVLYITMNIPSDAFTALVVYYCWWDGSENVVGSWTGYADKVLDDGFVRYAFMTKADWNRSMNYFYLDFANLAYPHMRDIIISDIAIDTTTQAAYEVRESYASTTDADVLAMFDNPVGVSQVGFYGKSGANATELSTLRLSTTQVVNGQSASIQIGWVNAKFWTGIQINPAGYSLERGKYVVFYVYNESTTGDTSTKSAKDIDLYVGTESAGKKVCELTSAAWTMVSIKSDDFIDGEFKLRFCPNNSEDDRIAGSIYISRMEVYATPVFALLDTEQGAEQVSPNTVTAAYDTDHKLNGEVGSLALAYSSATSGYITVATPNSETLSSGYLEFYVSNTTGAAITVAFGTASGTCGSTTCTVAAGGTWTLVCLPMSENTYSNTLVFYADSSVTGAVYVSRMMVYDTEVIGMCDKNGITTYITKPAGCQSFEKSFVKNYHIYGENGSLRIRYKNATPGSTAAIQINIPTGYTLDSGKYVVFYAYNNTNASYIDLALNTTKRVRLHSGVWTMVIYDSADVNTATFVERFFAYGFSGGDTTLTGDIYFSRIKVYSSTDVQDTTTADGTYNVGNGVFKQITYVGQGDYYKVGSGAIAQFGTTFFNDPYVIDGTLRTLMLPQNNGTATDPRIDAQFKEAIQAYSDSALYVTMKGAETDYGYVQAQIFCGGSHKGTRTATRSTDIGGGYYVYRFDLSGFANQAAITGFRLYTTPGESGQMKQVLISNIEIVREG